MRNYDTSFEGIVNRIFDVDGSVMPRAFSIALVPGVVAMLLVIVFPDGRIPYLAPDENRPILLETQAWNGFSFFVGFLLVFRTTQAYNRFWDACDSVLLMKSEFYDAAAGLVSFCKISTCSDPTIVRMFQEETVLLLCMLHGSALVELREGDELGRESDSDSDESQDEDEESSQEDSDYDRDHLNGDSDDKDKTDGIFLPDPVERMRRASNNQQKRNNSKDNQTRVSHESDPDDNVDNLNDMLKEGDHSMIREQSRSNQVRGLLMLEDADVSCSSSSSASSSTSRSSRKSVKSKSKSKSKKFSRSHSLTLSLSPRSPPPNNSLDFKIQIEGTHHTTDNDSANHLAIIIPGTINADAGNATPIASNQPQQGSLQSGISHQSLKPSTVHTGQSRRSLTPQESNNDYTGVTVPGQGSGPGNLAGCQQSQLTQVPSYLNNPQSQQIGTSTRTSMFGSFLMGLRSRRISKSQNQFQDRSDSITGSTGGGPGNRQSVSASTRFTRFSQFASTAIVSRMNDVIEEVQDVVDEFAEALDPRDAEKLQLKAERQRRKDQLFMWSSDEVCRIDHFDEKTRAILKACNSHDRVIILFSWVQNRICQAQRNGIIAISPPILSRTFQQLSRGMSGFYQALKISQVPFPFPYAQVCDLLLLIHWSLIPIVISQWTSNPIWASVFTVAQVLILWSLNLTALEIESPFGKDANDIELEMFQAHFNRAALFLLTREGMHSPQLKGRVGVEERLRQAALEAEEAEAELERQALEEMEEYEKFMQQQMEMEMQEMEGQQQQFQQLGAEFGFGHGGVDVNEQQQHLLDRSADRKGSFEIEGLTSNLSHNDLTVEQRQKLLLSMQSQTSTNLESTEEQRANILSSIHSQQQAQHSDGSGGGEDLEQDLDEDEKEYLALLKKNTEKNKTQNQQNLNQNLNISQNPNLGGNIQQQYQNLNSLFGPAGFGLPTQSIGIRGAAMVKHTSTAIQSIPSTTSIGKSMNLKGGFGGSGPGSIGKSMNFNNMMASMNPGANFNKSMNFNSTMQSMQNAAAIQNQMAMMSNMGAMPIGGPGNPFGGGPMASMFPPALQQNQYASFNYNTIMNNLMGGPGSGGPGWSSGGGGGGGSGGGNIMSSMIGGNSVGSGGAAGNFASFNPMMMNQMMAVQAQMTMQHQKTVNPNMLQMPVGAQMTQMPMGAQMTNMPTINGQQQSFNFGPGLLPMGPQLTNMGNPNNNNNSSDPFQAQLAMYQSYLASGVFPGGVGGSGGSSIPGLVGNSGIGNSFNQNQNLPFTAQPTINVLQSMSQANIQQNQQSQEPVIPAKTLTTSNLAVIGSGPSGVNLLVSPTKSINSVGNNKSGARLSTTVVNGKTVQVGPVGVAAVAALPSSQVQMKLQQVAAVQAVQQAQFAAASMNASMFRGGNNQSILRSINNPGGPSPAGSGSLVNMQNSMPVNAGHSYKRIDQSDAEPDPSAARKSKTDPTVLNESQSQSQEDSNTQQPAQQQQQIQLLKVKSIKSSAGQTQQGEKINDNKRLSSNDHSPSENESARIMLNESSFKVIGDGTSTGGGPQEENARDSQQRLEIINNDNRPDASPNPDDDNDKSDLNDTISKLQSQDPTVVPSPTETGTIKSGPGVTVAADILGPNWHSETSPRPGKEDSDDKVQQEVHKQQINVVSPQSHDFNQLAIGTDGQSFDGTINPSESKDGAMSKNSNDSDGRNTAQKIIIATLASGPKDTMTTVPVSDDPNEVQNVIAQQQPELDNTIATQEIEQQQGQRMESTAAIESNDINATTVIESNDPNANGEDPNRLASPALTTQSQTQDPNLLHELRKSLQTAQDTYLVKQISDTYEKTGVFKRPDRGLSTKTSPMGFSDSCSSGGQSSYLPDPPVPVNMVNAEDSIKGIDKSGLKEKYDSKDYYHHHDDEYQQQILSDFDNVKQGPGKSNASSNIQPSQRYNKEMIQSLSFVTGKSSQVSAMSNDANLEISTKQQGNNNVTNQMSSDSSELAKKIMKSKKATSSANLVAEELLGDDDDDNNNLNDVKPKPKTVDIIAKSAPGPVEPGPQRSMLHKSTGEAFLPDDPSPLPNVGVNRPPAASTSIFEMIQRRSIQMEGAGGAHGGHGPQAQFYNPGRLSGQFALSSMTPRKYGRPINMDVSDADQQSKSSQDVHSKSDGTYNNYPTSSKDGGGDQSKDSKDNTNNSNSDDKDSVQKARRISARLSQQSQQVTKPLLTSTKAAAGKKHSVVLGANNFANLPSVTSPSGGGGQQRQSNLVNFNTKVQDNNLRHSVTNINEFLPQVYKSNTSNVSGNLSMSSRQSRPSLRKRPSFFSKEGARDDHFKVDGNNINSSLTQSQQQSQRQSIRFQENIDADSDNLNLSNELDESYYHVNNSIGSSAGKDQQAQDSQAVFYNKGPRFTVFDVLGTLGPANLSPNPGQQQETRKSRRMSRRESRKSVSDSDSVLGKNQGGPTIGIPRTSNIRVTDNEDDDDQNNMIMDHSKSENKSIKSSLGKGNLLLPAGTSFRSIVKSEQSEAGQSSHFSMTNDNQNQIQNQMQNQQQNRQSNNFRSIGNFDNTYSNMNSSFLGGVNLNINDPHVKSLAKPTGGYGQYMNTQNRTQIVRETSDMSEISGQNLNQGGLNRGSINQNNMDIVMSQDMMGSFGGMMSRNSQQMDKQRSKNMRRSVNSQSQGTDGRFTTRSIDSESFDLRFTDIAPQ